MLAVWCALIALFLLAILGLMQLKNWFAEHQERREAVKDIGCMKPHFLLGHLKELSPTQAGLLNAVKRVGRFPKCTLLWFGPFVVYLSCFHPDLIRTLLNSDEPKDDAVYRFIRPWIGDGLLTSSGKKWKRNRRLIAPAFHPKVLEGYVKNINDGALEMLRKWTSPTGEPVRIEVFHDVGSMALDNLLRCLMSKNSGCESEESSEYLLAVRDISEIIMKRLFNPLHQIDFVFFNLTSSGRKLKKALKVAHEYTENIVSERKIKIRSENSSVTSRVDFLDILIKAKDESGIGLTHEEICDEVDTFIFEGHDTVTSGISFVLYNLAKHPCLQEKCRDETLAVIGDRETVNWRDLTKLTYLTMFIKESMRMYPPVSTIGRSADQPVYFSRGFGSDQYNLDTDGPAPKDSSRTIPKGVNFAVDIFVLHRNPNLWKDPEQFDPERFTPENISKRPPYSYVPFSSGPRNCVGQNFAMNEMKIVLSLALSRYRFTIDDLYPEIEMQPHIVLRTTSGIHLKAEGLYAVSD